MVHSECWRASAPLNANLSENSLAANTHNASDQSLTWLLTLRNRIAGAKSHCTGQQGTPSLSGPWTRNTHCQRSAPEVSWTSPIEPCVSDLVTVRLASKRPPPLPNTIDGESTSVIQKQPLPSHIAEARGRLRMGLPSRSMIKQLFFAYASSVTQELCFTCGSTTSEAASTSIYSAGTKPLLKKQELVFLSRLARWNKCWDLSCGIALITAQDQIWWKESSQTAPLHI